MKYLIIPKDYKQDNFIIDIPPESLELAIKKLIDEKQIDVGDRIYSLELIGEIVPALTYKQLDYENTRQ